MSIYLILDLKLKIHMKNMHEILTGLTLERTAANACMPQNISNQKVRDDLSTDDLKNENDLKNKDDLKNRGDQKM